ncbi:MAG: hypothetical protein K2O04_07095 [Clostridiales bacterium]|nr:hypothetical protein [Clostridiales bacterium]
MDEKDRQIERLFDDYASSLEPNEQLANRAKQKMQSKRKAKKRPIFWVGFACACAAAVAVAVFSVSSFFGSDDLAGNNSDNSANSAPPIRPAPAVQSYSISDVRAVSVDYGFANDYINTTGLDGAEVFSQSYYACYIKDTNEFAYLKAVLGVSYNGGNIQMSVVAEMPEYANKEREQDYGSLTVGTGYKYYTEYINGEYVTMAYCKTEDCKYYVSAMGNAKGAQDVVAEIIGQNN